MARGGGSYFRVTSWTTNKFLCFSDPGYIFPLLANRAFRSGHAHGATDVATPSAPPLAYTIPDACEVLCIKKAKLYNMVKAGEIEAKKMGGRTIILRSSIEKLLANLPPLNGST